MNIFAVHANVVNDYKSYITGFINIQDEAIRNTVEQELDAGKLWPEPLLQFNPAFKPGDSVEALCKAETLHPVVADIFHGYSLYEHQVAAIRKGSKREGFVVTSGTGSGKSLTYLATIFNDLLLNPPATPGVRAVIVYPMNALINSQFEEIEKYKVKYETVPGRKFPITFGQYTGQEKDGEKESIRLDPPHILLTNYMMLELVLTRTQERTMRATLFENLRFLVFDELHTYRGRQGADVSLLIRRLRAQAKHDVISIGTSATMVTGGTLAEQREQVATVASTIFGTPFTAADVINETLDYSLGAAGSDQSGDQLRAAVAQPIDPTSDEAALRRHPLAGWLENEVALQIKEGTLVRGEPRTLTAIADLLHRASGAPQAQCKARLQELLDWLNSLNAARKGQRGTLLPFKLHQFISQTGAVYVSLAPGPERIITLDPGVMREEKRIYPVAFSRASGYAFICVAREGTTTGVLNPREFRRQGNDGQEAGYLILGNEPDGRDVWDEAADREDLPDSWLNRGKNGSISKNQPYAADKRASMPERIWFDDAGNYATLPDDALPHFGWWMRESLLFDPTSGLFYDQRTNEGTKLTTLGSEGRSTSTTVLSSTILKQLAGAGVDSKEEKILSFTDNRQDAALQAGHFNDFVQVAHLRAGILRALDQAEGNALDFASLPQAVFDALALPITAYSSSDNPSPFAAAQRDTRNALKDYLLYCALYDLRRGWRVIMPNLEQCGLLAVDYANLDEICADYDEDGQFQWTGVPLLAELTADRRAEVVRQLLDYFRTSYALHNEEYLTPEKMRQRFSTIHDELRDPYRLEKGEIPEPYVLTYRPLAKNARLFTASVGAQSNVGRYLRRIIDDENELRKNNRPPLLADASRAHYEDLITGILDAFEGARWLTKTAAEDRDQNPISVYRLNASKLIWRLGDGQTIRPDRVRNRAYKATAPSPTPSAFFQELYRTGVTEGRKRVGREHTGQLGTKDRQDREDAFREGKISALFCSPTMELGIDIASLNVVHMRNVPPNPANYAQRSGRAGRSGQAALVVTYCSNYSPHDRHYFAKATAMVAGQVAAPRLDLGQHELLASHLNALFLAELGTDDFNASLANVVDTDNLKDLPLRPSLLAALTPTSATLARIRRIFEEVLKMLPEKDRQAYDGVWIDRQLDKVVGELNKALGRWRTLYKLADKQLQEAQAVLRDPIHTDNSPKRLEAKMLQSQAIKQRDLLRNEVKRGHQSGSEFYPFRYLAAEGFLPGYNFTRLPIRTFLPKGTLDGEFVSRPRAVALREFGPRNIVYHNGAKYRIEQLQVASMEQSLRSAKVSTGAGYFMMEGGDDYHRSVCPFSGAPLDGEAKEEFKNVLVEMTETRAEEIERISCEEEERRSEGFLIDTYFTLTGGLDTRQLATVRSGESDLLNVSYLPAAQLVHVNRKWRSAKETGFLIGMTYGKWQRETEQKPKKGEPAVDPATKEPTHRIQLFTTTTADALYLEPIAALALDQAGVVTLQYALKRAIEQVFQLEPNEIGVTLMGRHEKKPANIFLYENAEGSLGVLKQFVQDKDVFHRVVKAAHDLCRLSDEADREKASYSDLLSYYNQRDHNLIDRNLIREALKKLAYAQVELQTNPHFADYEHHYQHLLKTYDTSSSTERRFLEYLYQHNYRLPDVAQLRVDDLYCQPDFCYDDPEMRTWIFCDGTPHDEPAQKVRDQQLRAAIKSRGDAVITYHYLDSLPDLVAARPDLFRKVR